MNPFELVAEKLIDLGFYDFLFPFIITAAIFYGLLRKTKILGESVTINGVLAICIAFMLFGFPKLVGVALGTPLSTFFTQATVWILMIGMGVLIAGLFYPDLTKALTEMFTRRTALYTMIVVGIVLIITSGMLTILIGGLPSGDSEGAGGVGGSSDVIIIIVALIIFIILIIVASAIGGGVG